MNRRDRNIEVLHDTLQIFNNNKCILSQEDRCKVEVYLPDDIKIIYENIPDNHHNCIINVENIDSLDCALYHDNGDQALVLNFANPVHIGGGVYRGARAQEEDICRRSSLLNSLESKEAYRYYQYNKSLHTYLGSNAMIYSPYVEVIKDNHYQLLDKSYIISIITCAAPVMNRNYDLSIEEYNNMMYQRIKNIIYFAIYKGYRRLVLGAWGCGAFGNDAKVIAEMFYDVLKETKHHFTRIDFAVLDHSQDLYNHHAFYNQFKEEP